MSFVKCCVLTCLVAASVFPVTDAIPYQNSRAFESLSKRQNGNASSSLQVDLGYEIYEGMSNASTGLNTWKGLVLRLKNVFPMN